MSFNTATIPEFNPPGNLPDLTPENREIWSRNYISKWMNEEIAGGMDGPCNKPRTALSQFFNGTVTAFDTTQRGVPITWIAFPNLITTRYQGKEPLRWQIADATRMSQDEYLEWSVSRDQDGNILSAKFTCEGPEYWQMMADYQEDTMLQLYKDLNPEVADQMSPDDFFLVNQKTGARVYNPQNYWNVLSTSGTIAHLIQPNNTLSAEIDISAQATVMRIGEDGKLITDPLELINCSKYGNAGRNSDPVIGSNINALARQGTSISIKDPVALYIQGFDTSSLVLQMGPSKQVPLPDGIITYPRGAPPQGLRIHVEIPADMTNDAGEKLTVSDIYDTATSQPIMYGAQFADYITMGVSGVAINDVAVATAIKCPCAKTPDWGNLLPGKGTFDGIIRRPDGTEEHRLPHYRFRVR